MTLNILFPVLNEHLRLRRGIETCVRYMREHVKIPYALTIVDNGSDDDTPEIGRALSLEYPEVRYIRIEERGVGIAFKTGVLRNEADIVGYMDVDLSTDLSNVVRMLKLFQKHPELQYVNGSRFHRKSDTRGRKWYRKITSAGLVFLLKTIFGMRSTDALCGFTFLRKGVAEELVSECSDDKGWFYTVELLLRAEKKGITICDLPVAWTEDYDTTVKIFKTIKNYICQMWKLKKLFREEGI